MDWKGLGNALVAAGYADAERWRDAVLERERWGGDLARVLLDRGVVGEEILLRAMGQAMGLSVVDLDQLEVPADVIMFVPADVAETHRAIPVRREGNFLDVAMADPTDLNAVDDLRVHAQLNIRPHLTGPKMVERAMARYYGRVRVGACAVDPRVTSGTFLTSDVLDLDERSASGKVPIVGAPPTQPPGSVPQLTLVALAAKVEAQEQRIAMLESLVTRDEDVLRRLFGYLIDKGVASRDELVALLK